MVASCARNEAVKLTAQQLAAVVCKCMSCPGTADQMVTQCIPSSGPGDGGVGYQ